MWGIIIAVIIYALGILVVVGKEGIRETKSNTVWSEEELNKMKGASVMGWRLFALILIVMGVGVLFYSKSTAVPVQEELTMVRATADHVTKDRASGDIKITFLDDDKTYQIPNAYRVKAQEEKILSTTGKQVEILYGVRTQAFEKTKKYCIYSYQADGQMLLSYDTVKESDGRMAGVWKQLALFFFTAAGITLAVLLYAHVNPKVYKIICIYKPEKGIKPTVGQTLEREIGGIWEHNFKSKITTEATEKMEKKNKQTASPSVSNATITVEMDEQTYAEYLEFLKFREKLKQNS